MNLPSTFAMQADSAEAPRVAPLAEQPRSPDSLLPIAFSFAPRQPLPRALAGTPVHRTSASTPAVISTRAGKRSFRNIVHVSPSLGRRGVTLPPATYPRSCKPVNGKMSAGYL